MLFKAKSQRSDIMWRPGCTSVLGEFLNMSSSQIRPFLFLDAGKCKEPLRTLKKGSLFIKNKTNIKVKGMLSQRSYFWGHFVCIVPGLVLVEGGLLFMAWCFPACLEQSLSILPVFGLHSTQKLGYRAISANHLNWRAEVTLHWTFDYTAVAVSGKVGP